MQIRKNFIVINKGFVCKNCKKRVKKSEDGSCRNHCPYCLYSLHVDLEVPGDRLNPCKGLMMPIGLELNKKKGTRIKHMCKLCGEKSYNRSADDDNWDLICQLSRIPQE